MKIIIENENEYKFWLVSLSESKKLIRQIEERQIEVDSSLYGLLNICDMVLENLDFGGTI